MENFISRYLLPLISYSYFRHRI